MTKPIRGPAKVWVGSMNASAPDPTDSDAEVTAMSAWTQLADGLTLGTEVDYVKAVDPSITDRHPQPERFTLVSQDTFCRVNVADISADVWAILTGNTKTTEAPTSSNVGYEKVVLQTDDREPTPVAIYVRFQSPSLDAQRAGFYFPAMVDVTDSFNVGLTTGADASSVIIFRAQRSSVAPEFHAASAESTG